MTSTESTEGSRRGILVSRLPFKTTTAEYIYCPNLRLKRPNGLGDPYTHKHTLIAAAYLPQITNWSRP